MTSQNGEQTFAIHILPNILRSKCYQTMEFGIFYYITWKMTWKIKNETWKMIFLEKSYTKCGGETISTPSCKKPRLSISLDP